MLADCSEILVLQESMLVTVTKTSSACTGAFTAEMSLSVVEKTINDDGYIRPVSFTPVKVWAS